MKTTKKTRKKASKATKVIRAPLPMPVLISATLLLGVLTGATILFFTADRSPRLAEAALSGDTVKTVPIDVTLTHVEAVPARELITGTVVEGYTGYIVGVTVKNNTNTEQQFLPVNHAFVKGLDGETHHLAPVAGLKDPIEAGPVPAGETLSGEFSFIVPSSVQSPRLFIDTQWSNTVPVIFSLQ